MVCFIVLIDPPIYGWSWSVVTTLLHETQDVLVVDLWYSKYMIYSLRAFFTVAHFVIGGIVPELYQRPDPGHG